jgi:hypothetical protein
VNALALVDDGLLAGGLSDGVAGGVQSGEVGLVLVSRDVALLDVGDGNDLLGVDLSLVLGVEDGLDVCRRRRS